MIFGADGQLGRELSRTMPPGWDVRALTFAECDITHDQVVHKLLAQSQPRIVINAAAYTAVDKAESDPESAYAVNATAPGALAQATHQLGLRFIHISTDYVFSGQAGHPFQPGDPVQPLGVYGQSKAEGERLVMAHSEGKATILRTAWLYSAHGQNFPRTIVRLLRERDRLRVITDQVGSPTWARGLAQAIWDAAQLPEKSGTWHWTDAGVASWYDLAVAIQEEAIALGMLSRSIPIDPIPTHAYPLPAPRPAYSVLDCHATWEWLGWTPKHWRQALREMLKELVGAEQPSTRDRTPSED
ncbi:MAG: dTDP-4-dehydrorhamnose reductase [Magnetococcales bacterium]|nr:dTDP-4-dehydrorhamnose reductase [Magnetococcales bacterium]MBF0322775.1 dTDP-4-dehydrorhamnose reductase [Magnetococcales bacterium]